MAYKVQILADTKRQWCPATNVRSRNRIWLNVAHAARLSVAEKIAANLRVDSASVIVRIRPVGA